MLDPRLQPASYELTKEIPSTEYASEYFEELIIWATACLQTMQKNKVEQLNSLESVPRPSKFITDDFPINPEKMDSITKGFSACSDDSLIVLFSEAFAEAGLKDSNLLLLAYTALPLKESAWKSFEKKIKKIFERAPEKGKDHRLSVKKVFRDVLAEEMSEKGFGFDDFRKIFSWHFLSKVELDSCRELGIKIIHKNIPTLHEFIAALTVELKKDKNQLDWIDPFIAVLFSSTSGIYFPVEQDYIGPQPTDEDYIIGEFLANSEQSTEEWKKLWRSMTAVRFRIRHTSYERDLIPDDANRYLPIIGIASFDWLMSPEICRPSEAEALWEILWNAVYGSWLDSMLSDKEMWGHYILLLVVRKALLYKRDSKETIERNLRTCIEKLGDSPRLIASIACSLKLNVSLEIMEGLRPDIQPMIKSFLQSEKEKTIRQFTYPALTQACKALY